VLIRLPGTLRAPPDRSMCIMYSVKNLAYGTNKFVIESD
tara:strand:- start:717 stop:833 length:117 start_codon:yes stop_codon:yes gene_type:complete